MEDFPGLSGILGQAAWARLIEGYLEAHPLDSFDLRDLGLDLPAYGASKVRWLTISCARTWRG